MTPNRYTRRWAAYQAANRKAFIPFTLLGWPDADTSGALLQTMAGADVFALELGIAFNDPVADGPLIQAAVHETLSTGFSVDQAFALVAQVRQGNADLPIGLLVYYNTVLARGVERFYADAAAAGADGVLIADLPPECAEEVVPHARKHGIAPIFIVSPLTTPERLEYIARYAEGFLYVVSRLGITGLDERTDDTLAQLLPRLRQSTPLPLFVGFGISSPDHARSVLALGADGVITGSRIIRLMQDRNHHSPQAAVGPFLEAMLATTHPSH